ncbi:glycosyltransferase family 39 protein [Micromonospora maritima]|uniref:glycosyltransferase family 39 protein n=1 Tax=Micromonospora maritima TaxID=986711 RepID=UPI0031EECC89
MMDADTMVLPRLGPAEAGVEDPWGEDRPRRGPTRAARRPARWRVAAWLLPALLTGGLGGVGLGIPGLRAEELDSWRAATAPWRGLRSALAGDEVTLAPYHLLIRGWAALFGAADPTLRVPSLLAMTAAAALVGALAARMFTPGTGVLAGLLFAALPTTTRYAQEAQPHALAVFAAVLATWLLPPALDRPGVRRLAPYAGAVLLLGLCQPVALLLLAGHGWVVLAFRRAAVGRWLAAAGLAALPVAALLWSGVRAGARLAPGVRVDPAALVTTPRDLFGVAAVGALLAGLALFSLPLRYAAAICTAWALVPALGLLLVARTVPVWSPAVLLSTVPAWAVLGAAALSRTRAGWAVAGLAAVALAGAPAQAAVRAPDGHGQDPRRVAAIVGGLAQRGDGVLYADPTARTLLARYVPADRRPADVPADPRPLACAGCPDGHRRLWVIRSGTGAAPPGDGPAERALRAGYRPAQVWRPTGFTVALFVGGRPASA